jgi:cell division protein FtsB
MTTRHSFSSLLRRAAVPALVLSVAYYLGYNLVQGERGLLAWTDINQELETNRAELERLQMERQALAHKVSLLRPDNLDPDMLDERSREVLGLADKNEVVIFLDDPLGE